MTTEPDVLDVECPTCGADPGQECIWTHGPTYSETPGKVHVARYAEASVAIFPTPDPRSLPDWPLLDSDYEPWRTGSLGPHDANPAAGWEQNFGALPPAIQAADVLYGLLIEGLAARLTAVELEAVCDLFDSLDCESSSTQVRRVYRAAHRARRR